MGSTWRTHGNVGGRLMERCARPPAWLRVGVVVDYHRVIGGPVTRSGLRSRSWSRSG